MSCESLLIESLRARGMRLTPQREMVLAVLHELGGHASVDEIYQQVHGQSEAVDKSTVYRTLELLQDLGIVMDADLGDGIKRYELASHGAHGHLRCACCGRVASLDMADLEKLKSHLMGAFGFAMRDHQVIVGLCAICQRRAKGGDAAVTS